MDVVGARSSRFPHLAMLLSGGVIDIQVFTREDSSTVKIREVDTPENRAETAGEK